MAPTKTQTVHSKIYWLLIVIAVILGLPGTIGIYLWISNHTTHSVRIPVYLLALPIIILIWAAGAIDAFLVGHCPNLVPESKRWMLAAGAQGQGQPAGPGPAQAVPAQAPAAAGAPQAAYGHAEPGAVQQAQQGPYQQPGSYPPGDGAPAPYGQSAHQPGAAQQGSYQQPGSYQPGATQQGPYHQPGSYQPGTNTAASGYGTVPPATGYGAPS